MKKLITFDEAVESDRQHESPCSDCPWARVSLPGWLGGLDVEDWIQAVRGDGKICCHTVKGQQCAGAAIYRANTCKLSRDPSVLRLKRDKDEVFASSEEFRKHHDIF